MITLRKPVYVIDVDAYGAAVTKAGHIVGISRCQPPRYDVMVDGAVVSNLGADRIREITNRRDIFGVVK